MMLKFIKERLNDYNANAFVNELAQASKQLGALELRLIHISLMVF